MKTTVTTEDGTVTQTELEIGGLSVTLAHGSKRLRISKMGYGRYEFVQLDGDEVLDLMTLLRDLRLIP